MWAVLKFKKKEFYVLKNNLKEKLGDNFLIYRPKLLIQNYKANKEHHNIHLLLL